jgi:phage gp36-like protein
MSSYCSQSDIIGEIQLDNLIQLTDDAPVTGYVNTTILAQVIANASGEIDRMVGNVYDVPFVPVPPSVESMAIVITCYRLYRRRETPDELNKYFADYRIIREHLKAVHERKDVLDLSVQNDFSQVAANVRSGPYGWGNWLPNSQ